MLHRSGPAQDRTKRCSIGHQRRGGRTAHDDACIPKDEVAAKEQAGPHGNEGFTPRRTTSAHMAKEGPCQHDHGNGHAVKAVDRAWDIGPAHKDHREADAQNANAQRPLGA